MTTAPLPGRRAATGTVPAVVSAAGDAPVSKRRDAEDFPWWLVAAVMIAIVVAIIIAANDIYTQVFQIVAAGVWTTVFVTIVAYALASALGLGIALLGLSGSIWLRQFSRFYVEMIRSVPILVLLFWIAFAGVPIFVAGWNWAMTPLRDAGLVDELLVRDFSLLWRAVLALTIAYSSFIAEIFRAGIQSVEIGQIEAAKALGLSRYRRFRHVVWPQAFRTILPPYSNDFIAMVKDSSLVSVLGVADITQMGKVYAAGTFRFFDTYSIVAYIYLLLTVSLSLALRALEKRMRRGTEHERTRSGSVESGL